MAKGLVNLQDWVLNQLRKDNMPCTIYLVNGFQLKGIIRAFDSFTVVIDVDGRQQMVYKHAISTIMPLRALNLSEAMNQPRED